MKNLYKAAIVAALGLASVTAAQATPGDIVLGFTPATPGTDYVIDLGALDATTSADLTSFVNNTTFASVLSAAGAGNLSVGATGGNATGLAGQYVFATGATAGSVFAATAPSANNANGIINTYSLVSGIGSSVQSSDLTSFTAVSAALAVNGVNANTAVTVNGTTSFGLFENVDASVKVGRATVLQGNWVQVGTFSLTEVGSAVTSLTFTGVNAVSVPEPTSIAAFGGAGLLLLSLRNKFRKA